MPEEEDAEPLEIELKLGVVQPDVVREAIEDGSPDVLAGFEALGPAATVTVVDRYLDTSPTLTEGRLAANGLKARLREAGDEVIVTVKRASALEGVVMTRVELEAPATPSLDPETWPDSPARRAIVTALGSESLVEVVALRQRRLKRRFARDGTEVELSLDELEALHGGAVVERRWDIEAELVRGDVGPLHELADALRRLPGVEPPMTSKREWAFRAVEGA